MVFYDARKGSEREYSDRLYLPPRRAWRDPAGEVGEWLKPVVC